MQNDPSLNHFFSELLIASVGIKYIKKALPPSRFLFFFILTFSKNLELKSTGFYNRRPALHIAVSTVVKYASASFLGEFLIDACKSFFFSLGSQFHAGTRRRYNEVIQKHKTLCAFEASIQLSWKSALIPNRTCISPSDNHQQRLAVHFSPVLRDLEQFRIATSTCLRLQSLRALLN